MNRKENKQWHLKINYEVFVSKTMLDDILRMSVQGSIRFFQLVILSESLSNKEVEMIVPQLFCMNNNLLTKSQYIKK